MTFVFLAIIIVCAAIVGATAYELGAGRYLARIAIRIHYTGRRGE